MTDLPNTFAHVDLMILDMDGVLTSEEAYWDAAGLVADGETEVFDIYHLDRGYSDMDGKLRRVGAGIERIEDV